MKSWVKRHRSDLADALPVAWLLVSVSVVLWIALPEKPLLSDAISNFWNNFVVPCSSIFLTFAFILAPALLIQILLNKPDEEAHHDR